MVSKSRKNNQQNPTQPFEESIAFKIIIVIVGLLFLMSGIAGLFELDDEPSTDRQQQPQANQQRQVAEYSKAPQEPTAQGTNQATGSKDEFHYQNESVQVGPLSVKVTEAIGFSQMGGSLYTEETEGLFLKLTVELTNKGSETIRLYPDNIRIIDYNRNSSIRMFERFDGDYLYIASPLDTYMQLPPGVPKRGSLVFEIPKDVTILFVMIEMDDTHREYILLQSIPTIIRDTTKIREEQEEWETAMQTQD